MTLYFVSRSVYRALTRRRPASFPSRPGPADRPADGATAAAGGGGSDEALAEGEALLRELAHRHGPLYQASKGRLWPLNMGKGARG